MVRHRFSLFLRVLVACVTSTVFLVACAAEPVAPAPRLASGTDSSAQATVQRALYGNASTAPAMGIQPESSFTAGAIEARPMLPHQGQESVAASTHALPPANTDTVKVALLLPLTGRNAALGRAMQDAATLSLFDKYARLGSRKAMRPLQLLPKDTGDTPEQAVVAAKEAIEEGAGLLIGPLFADATEAVAPVAQAHKVPVLSFSNSLTHAGNGVYMFGFSPQDQTVRIVDFAIHQGKTRIAILAPDSPMGNAVLSSARQTIGSLGFVPAAEVKYSAQGIGIDEAANALLSEGNTPHFDAVLIPEGGAVLATILRALRARGISPATTQFLGTGIWDDGALIRRVPLDGAWIASSSPKETALFETRFRDTYHDVPPRIASLAYDAVALAVTLASSGRHFDEATLTNPAGFVGPANGVFRLRRDGRVERSLAIIHVEGGLFTPIEAAPSGFHK